MDKTIAAINEELSVPRATGVAADLSRSEGAAAMIKAVPEADILVNNLGIHGARLVFELVDADWDHIFNVNVTSAARLSRHYAPKMQEKGWRSLACCAGR